ncbi:MAG: sigma-70 family RNA polymerase sigma factor [Fibromonadaceae bacterium]|jgi:RNA polymerase sigma-70 factor (ECF subfamily)|nr:sigma-70 family RNA polymerase sigma factor [Fibromonadaceae bacterium]
MNISQLWEEHAEFVLRICQRFLKNNAAAEDIRQEVFLKIINTQKNFKEDSSTRTWLYSIAYHCCMDYFRAQRRETQMTYELSRSKDLFLNDSQSPVWIIDTSEMPCPLSQLFVELYFEEGWSKEEISLVFGFCLDYINKKIKTGLQHLQEKA